MNEKSDIDLLIQIKNGSISAYEILVKRYQQRLFSFTYRILRNEQDAQEVVQDSLFKVYIHIDQIDLKQKFSTYVFTIVKNASISKIRMRKMAISLEDIVVANEDEDIYVKMSRSDSRLIVQMAILKLEPKYRQIIKLYYFEELSYEEIGKRIGLPLNTVRTRLRRGKEALKRFLPYENH